MVDYKKWDHIEVSDDEDETHPNIDTPSLFKWRHEARIQKMGDLQSKKDQLQKSIEANNEKKQTMTSKLEEAKKKNDTEQIKVLEKSLNDVLLEEKNLLDQKNYLIKEEKAMPLNVDTLSQPGFSKTIINKPQVKKEELSEEEKMERSKKFMEENKADIKKYGMLHEYHDSESMLLKNPHLACEDTANYLVVWCIDLEVEEKHALMERVAHQTICMQFLLELAKQLEIDPRSAIKSFFQKMRKADETYDKGFKDELSAFIGRVKERAQARIDKAMKEYEEEERAKRLGPGGLDPVEVFESLPKSLQECFESKDIAMLQETMSSLPEEEARYHLKRCIDSGLWVPGPTSENETNNETSA
ncbi:hsp90 co-chaperone Cdc37 isoform X1 [Hydra vulgaris]|uniref:hsp90 co-chaperone Cdc37 isoform X1 n=1 Tax=Hydra vulgaris TaxID=6087 RepID=UPI001F5FD551|nr:hsp90 co-chaperone Cdc37 [Hydra vulgaris]